MVQIANSYFNIRQELGIYAAMVAHPIAPRLTEGGLEFLESESAAEGQVHQGQRSVRDVHSANNMNIVWDVDPFALELAVAKAQSLGILALVGLQQGKHFSEYLGRVASIDFLDHHHIIRIQIAACGLNHFQERPIHQIQPSLAGRPPTSDKILI